MPDDSLYQVYGHSGLWKIVRRGTNTVTLKPATGGSAVNCDWKDITKVGVAQARPINVLSGFHILKDHWTDFDRVAEYCDLLRANLPAAIEATQAQTPQRTKAQGFQTSLRHNATRPVCIPERQLEWDLFAAFRPDRPANGTCDGLWKYLVAFQLPLYDDCSKETWGHCDLIGCGNDFAPIVIELKQQQAKDSPLRSVLEAASYSIALRKVWSKTCAELHATWSELGISMEMQSSPPKMEAVVLAPDLHWDYVVSRMNAQSWDRLKAFIDGLRAAGIEVSLARLAKQNDCFFDIRPWHAPE